MDKFWNTKEGRILSYGIHDHNHGLSRIANNVRLIKEDFDNMSKEQIFNRLDRINEGKKTCRESVDYIYSKIKKLQSE